jgi:tRNA(fMet)-specific endonuclease VapC
MRYLIDSDYVADYLVAKPHATELLTTLAHEGIGISLITVGEIYEGIYYGRDPQKAEEVFLRFMRIARPIALTSKIIQQFAQIRGALRRKGQIIGDFDILIAATAICHHLTLVTRNTKDYERISQLQLYKIS